MLVGSRINLGVSRAPLLIALFGIIALILVVDSQVHKPIKIKSNFSPQPAATNLAAPTVQEEPMPQATPQPSPQNFSSSSNSSSVSNHSSTTVNINNSSSQTSTSGSSSISLNSVTANGQTISLDATANPGAVCQVETSGAGAPGNFSQTADNNGRLYLNWAAASGNWNIKVSCGSASASTSVTVP